MQRTDERKYNASTVCVMHDWTKFSVMTLDGRMIYFTIADTIRQLLGVILKNIESRKL
jgi:hypothetical protein